MPSTVEAAFVFSLLIVPGFLLRRGYVRGRTHAVPPLNLYALAEAVVASLLLLALVWYPFDLPVFIRRANAGTVVAPANEDQTFLLFALMLSVPWLVGWVAGTAVEAITERPAGRSYQLLEKLRMLGPPSLWDAVWPKMRQTGRVWAVVRTKDGREIVGIFAGGSKAALSPLPHEIYLEQEYGYDEQGQFLLLSDEGVYVAESEIVSVHFKRVQDDLGS